ncbi:unnamed protein product [Brachionus calyciflorus]|uniref:F-box domain-containing protein n=1 Tax=Brachionus calyciflorus TaxID=104777 RepID=A0A814BYZ9_9BILA|nr:unnamed protein product [Brachionus calyciflorus]
MDLLPDEILLKIFSYLDLRDLVKCGRVSRLWNQLSKCDELWRQFSLTDIQKPKWCPSKLVKLDFTNHLITQRFSPNITRVDLAKLCFTFETLDLLFQNCQHIKSLCINFKYLQIKAPLFQVEQCIHTWPVNKLEKLYLKNVCDMKTRRLNTFKLSALSKNCLSSNAPYDIIELEIIKLIRILFNRNSNSLRVLGLKCVDPNIITSCMNNFGNLEILLLNNVNDTDSVLEDLAFYCRNLKCLEIDKCRDFQGDGLQEIVEQCTKLETLQLGKNVYPNFSELTEINWANLNNLKELSITTKFQINENESSSSSSSSSSSNESNRASSVDVYAKTLFKNLNESKLEYLALTDFTLKFPHESEEINNVEQPLTNVKKRQKKDDVNFQTNLKYLFLRNIRNVKHLNTQQYFNLKSFLLSQYNLQTLDLLGLYLDTKFLCEIVRNLPFLKNLYFGHGKSYKKSMSSRKFLKSRMFKFTSQEYGVNCVINIDEINSLVAQTCTNLVNYGIFYRQSELRFRRDENEEFRNEALIKLLRNCENLKEISYLKSFKIQDDDTDEDDDDSDILIDENEESDEDEEEDEVNMKNMSKSNKKKSYFYFVKYAIENASVRSTHVNMKPCYGFDITPSSGHLLDVNNFNFIETSLPLIQPPKNDFHKNVLKI